jgi:hypothetical protein
LAFVSRYSIVDSRPCPEAIQSPARTTNGAIAPVSGGGENHIEFRTCPPALWCKGPRPKHTQGWQRCFAILGLEFFFLDCSISGLSAHSQGQDLLLLSLPVRQLLLSGRLYTTSFSSITSNSWIFELEHAGMIKQGLIIPWLGYS